MTFTRALKQISKKPWPDEALYEAERINEQCEAAVKLLAKRHHEITIFIGSSILAEVTAKKVKANAKKLTGVMKKCMRAPGFSVVCGPLWLDFEVSINPLVEGIVHSYGAMRRNYNKLNKILLKELGGYAEISKSVKIVIKDAEKEVYK